MSNADLFDRVATRRGILMLEGDHALAADLRFWARRRECMIHNVAEGNSLSVRVVGPGAEWVITIVCLGAAVPA